MSDGYNGYSNYETWAVCLWLDNDEGSSDFWRDRAKEIAADVRDGAGNQFITERKSRAVGMLADELKAQHEEQAEEFMGNQSSVFADLINSAMSSVNWYEAAGTFFDDDESFEDVPEGVEQC